MFSGLIVETDGTELTKEMLSDYEDVFSVECFYNPTRPYDNTYDFEVFNYTPEGTAYVIHLLETDERDRLARSLMLEFDFITDVRRCYQTTYDLVFFDHIYVLFLNNPDLVINAEKYPEFEDMVIGETRYNWQQDLYLCTIEYDHIYREMKAQGMTEWEVHSHFCELKDLLNEKYSADFTSPYMYAIGFENADGFSATHSISAWHGVGDSNTDGEVDAADAAEMLVSAAQIGTGVDVAVTSAADVNADGLLNAEDAAAVLSYAAAKGTGADVSWVDILRR